MRNAKNICQELAAARSALELNPWSGTLRLRVAALEGELEAVLAPTQYCDMQNQQAA